MTMTPCCDILCVTFYRSPSFHYFSNTFGTAHLEIFSPRAAPHVSFVVFLVQYFYVFPFAHLQEGRNEGKNQACLRSCQDEHCLELT